VGVLAFALHLGVDYHLKIPALAMLVAMVAGMGVGRAWPATEAGERAVGPRSRSVDRAVAMTAAVAIAGAALGWAVPHYRGEADREAARRRLDGLAGARRTAEERRAVAGQAREAFTRAVARDPGNAQAWADRAYAAAIIASDEPARENELGLAAEDDARRALALSAAVPEFWLRRGVALDLQGRWLEAGEAFAEALRLAPVNATTWFYYAYHLSLNRATLSLARAAVATSLRLDPSRPEAEALRQHLAARR
jgi:tetratricopeptide (TPR) repeat protein